MVRAVGELPLAREVMRNVDGAIPDSIGQERSSLDNGGESQNEGLQGNPHVPEHGIATEGKVKAWSLPSQDTAYAPFLLKMEESCHNQMMGAKIVALRDTE